MQKKGGWFFNERTIQAIYDGPLRYGRIKQLYYGYNFYKPYTVIYKPLLLYRNHASADIYVLPYVLQKLCRKASWKRKIPYIKISPSAVNVLIFPQVL